jgi:hypothetical protein
MVPVTPALEASQIQIKKKRQVKRRKIPRIKDLHFYDLAKI